LTLFRVIIEVMVESFNTMSEEKRIITELN